MYHRSAGRVAFLLCAWLGLTQTVQAQKSTARFLLWQPSATTNAMGGVGTSLYGNAFAAYHNPAALAFSPSVSLVGSFVKPIPFFGDVAHSFFGISCRSNSFGAIAASANLFWKGYEVITGELDPTILGGFKEFDWSGKISYAASIRENTAIGASVSLLRINLAEQLNNTTQKGDGNVTSIMIDAGILFKHLFPQATQTPSGFEIGEEIPEWADNQQEKGLSLGLALLNLGPKVVFVDQAQADHLPTRLMLGLAYWPIASEALGLMLATDFEKQLHEASTLDYLHLGSEAKLFSLFRLRAGYFLDTYSRRNSFFTLGGSVHTRYFSVNLARYTRTILPSWHVDGTFSLALR